MMLSPQSKAINAAGGINGRKINFISYDDGYSPPKTVEMERKLVEQDQVALLFQTLGTPSNSAIHKYMNQQKVPHLFVATGATKWNDPKNFPWTMGWQPNYQTEGQIYAKHLLAAYRIPVVRTVNATGGTLNLGGGAVQVPVRAAVQAAKPLPATSSSLRERDDPILRLLRDSGFRSIVRPPLEHTLGA